MTRKILIFTLTLTNLIAFSGNFDCQREAEKLLASDLEAVIAYEKSLNPGNLNALRNYIIDNSKILLDVIKPGLESLPYVFKNDGIAQLELGATKITGGRFINEHTLITISNMSQIDFWDTSVKNKPKHIKRINIPLMMHLSYSDISADGKYAIIGNRQLRFLNLATNEERSNGLDIGSISKVDSSKDGKRFIAYATNHNFDKKLYYYNIVTGETKTIISYPSSVAAISPCGKYILYARRKAIYIHDLEKNKSRKIFQGSTDIHQCGVFSPDSRYIYVDESTYIYCIDIAKSLVVKMIDLKHPIKTVCLDSTGRFTVVSTEFNTFLVDWYTTELKILNKQAKNLKAIISPSGKTVVLPAQMGDITNTRLYDSSTCAIQNLSLTALIILLKVAQEKNYNRILAYYKYFELTNRQEASIVKSFFAKRLMELYFAAPAVLQTIVKQYM